jgi:hypothetical protein
MAKKGKQKPFVDFVVEGVLSYPAIDKPRIDDKGKERYQTDILFDKDDAQLSVLRKKVNSVRVKAWGADKTEWPKKGKRQIIRDGDEREDQPVYKDKFYISVGSGQPVSVINQKGKTVAAAMVKGGMTAKVAIAITTFDNKFGEGISVYLQSIMLDPNQERLPGFGGGKSAKQHFKDHLDEESDEDEEEEDDSDDEDEDEDLPRSKKKGKKKPARDEDDEDEEEEDDSDDEDEEEDDEPVRKKKPSKTKKRPARDEDDEDEEEEDDED